MVDEKTEKALPPPEETEEEELGGHMSFIEHLEELRARLIRMIVVFAVVTIVCFVFSAQLIDIIRQPIDQAQVLNSVRLHKVVDYVIGLLDSVPGFSEETVADAGAGGTAPESGTATPESADGAVAEDEIVPIKIKLTTISPPEIFFARIKASIVAAIFVCFPYLFYEIWSFVSPGLYRREKRFVLPTVFSTWFCFIIGGLFAYSVVLPFMILFFAKMNVSSEIEVSWSLAYYINNVLHLVLAFGVIFEEPVVIALLAKLGLVTAKGLRKARAYVIVGLFVLGAMVTPPDPLSQFMCAVPLIGLYEISIRMVPLFASKEDEEEIPAA